MLIIRLAAEADRGRREGDRGRDEGPLTVWAADQVAVCEAIGPGRILLVSAVRPGTELRRALYGERLLRRLEWLAVSRTLHGRRD
jgi:hypothetical protein